jgi:serine/threonine protein kinase/tetratricopeptide (TPR) repeat protein
METRKPESIDDIPATGFAAPEECADADRTMMPGDGADPDRTRMPGVEGAGARRYPEKIGHYRILRLLGEGGMGSVFLAEQENPHRIVALKVIKLGFVSADLLRRFEQEAHALGRLQHPGIAQIYEAGMADSGFGPQPYFAMEYISGQTLIEYVEEHRLDVRARLELMAKVCDAMNHAHQRGIIHRDLKPGNILVDQAGQPKILDFGVARVADSEVEMTRQTDLGQLLGTLPYMSPEQVQPDPEELDIRSDVYALGVIMYELLAGHLPHDMRQMALPEIVQTIRDVDPISLGSIKRIYRGDIETIVAKALEKDKTRRYASAAELAADIRRYLADQPIVARPPTTNYQLQKFARRHKALVSGAVAVVLALSVGVVVSTWQLVRARRAEAAAQAVNDFLQDDLLAQASAANQSGPTTKPDADLKVRTALDRAAIKITGKFDKQPGVEASIRDTIGQTYSDLGLYPEARKQLELALELHQRVEGPNNPKTLTAAMRLGSVAEKQGKYAEAEALQNQTIEAMRRVLGPEHPDTLKATNGLATVYMDQAKYAQAEAIYTQNLEIERRVLGPENSQTLRGMHSLGAVYLYEGKYAQAEPFYSRTVEIERRVLGPEHPNTLLGINNLATLYQSEGKYAQAEVLFSQILEIYSRISGPEHPDTLLVMNGLAGTFTAEGKYAQAEALYSKTAEIQGRVLGHEHPSTLSSRYSLGQTYFYEGKYEQAEALLTQTFEIRRRVLGAEHPGTLRCSSYLAYTYALEGKNAEAEALFNRDLEVQRRVRGPENEDTLTTLTHMAFLYEVEGKYGSAETFAAQALAGRRHILGSEHPATAASEADLAQAYVSGGKFTESEPLAREALAFQLTKEPDNWQHFWAESLLGASLTGEKRYVEAEPLLLEGYRGMVELKDRMPVPKLRDLESARVWIVQMYVASGKPQKANEWRHT